MIQRIQSLFLLLASGGFWSLFALPIANSSEAGTTVYANSTLDLQDNMTLLILCVLGGVLSLGAIFLFKNRTLQKSIATVVILLGLSLVGFAYWFFTTTGNADSGAGQTSLSLGIAMPLVSSILAILATVFIGKDDKLVKSMDRLR